NRSPNDQSATTMPYRQTDRVIRRLSARREAILAAACDVLAQKGIAAIQIIPVAERVGIAAGTVYRYFPSKADLLAAVVRTACEQEVAALDRAVSQAPGPLSALAAAVTTFAARAISRRPCRWKPDACPRWFGWLVTAARLLPARQACASSPQDRQAG